MLNARRESTRSSYANFIAFALLAAYGVLYWQSLSRYWFSPEWTSDDALQQVYPFYEALFPGRFAGDIVTESMMSYFSPLHYWLCFGLTRLTGDPVMMAHWVTLIQLGLTLGFLFLAVRAAAGFVPGCLASLWFLHSRHLTQRLTGGLSRGWVAPLCAAFLWLIFTKRHFHVRVLLLLACFLNPLAAFMLILGYGAYFALELVRRGENIKRPLLLFFACCPIYFLATVQIVKRPEHLGRMVTYEEAQKMPELAKKQGRFELLPFAPPLREISFYSLQVFVATFHKGYKWWKKNTGYVVAGLLALLIFIGIRRRKEVVPLELAAFVAAVLIAYFMARAFAFQLYIPVRYIRIPLGLSLIVIFCVGAWRAFPRSFAYAAYAALAGIVYLGSGSGLQKQGNFNFKVAREGTVFAWLRDHTPESAIVAGYPNFVDPTQLLAVRKVYISNETAHPFYDKYYEVVKRRLEVSLRAHYARNFHEFLEAVANEPIDYFVFERKRFYPKELEKARYFGPFDGLVKKLASRAEGGFAYRDLPRRLDLQKYPFLVYLDKQAAVIDVQALKKARNN